MIASFEHNYIFIKTVKVGGTSVELALSRHCGPRDIITPIHPRDELLREPGAARPQNFSSDPDLEAKYAAAIDHRDTAKLWKLTRALEPKLRFFNHMRAPEIRRGVGEEFWRRAFKFTIDRNPYDRVVSGAFWMAMDRGLDTDLDTIRRLIDESIGFNMRNFDFYRIDGRISVDRILRYENLASELASIAGKIGGDISTSLPHAKAARGRQNRPASSFLTSDQKRLITERYADAFEALGYTRED